MLLNDNVIIVTMKDDIVVVKNNTTKWIVVVLMIVVIVASVQIVPLCHAHLRIKHEPVRQRQQQQQLRSNWSFSSSTTTATTITKQKHHYQQQHQQQHQLKHPNTVDCQNGNDHDDSTTTTTTTTTTIPIVFCHQKMHNYFDTNNNNNDDNSINSSKNNSTNTRTTTTTRSRRLKKTNLIHETYIVQFHTSSLDSYFDNGKNNETQSSNQQQQQKGYRKEQFQQFVHTILTNLVPDYPHNSTRTNIQVLHYYAYTNNLYAIAITNVSNYELEQLLNDSYVQYVEPDHIVSKHSLLGNTGNNHNQVQTNLNIDLWGLDRIDQQQCLLCTTSTTAKTSSGNSSTTEDYSNEYRYDYSGTNVYGYIIDSGIQTMHSEFTYTKKKNSTSKVYSRASCGYNFRSDLNEPCEDEWGHGTHVASLIGGKTYGVAKNVTLIAIKVFGKDGTSRFSNILAAVDYIIQEKIKYPKRAMFINLSLGTSHIATLLNTIVSDAIEQYNIPVIVAAGNSNVDACTFSPASVQSAITVAGSTIEDTRSISSNWGTCVDIYAPGSSILGAWIDDSDKMKILSGTSMATAFVSGAVALYLEKDYPTISSVATIRNRLRNDALYGVLTDKTKDANKNPDDEIDRLSPNLLLNVQSLLVVPTTTPTTSPTPIPTTVPTTQQPIGLLPTNQPIVPTIKLLDDDELMALMDQLASWGQNDIVSDQNLP